MHPKVSVIVPCYNQAHYLADCLNSLLAQRYSNWECVIVDDGSKDDTRTVSEGWAQKDSRIKYIYKQNGGLAAARNTGIENCEGLYILPLDSDDKIGSDYIREAVKVLGNNADVKVVYCEAELFENKSGKWELPEFSLERLACENMIFCSALFRKSDWQATGGYDPNMIYGFEDWEFWISMLKSGGKVVKLPIVGFYYRIRNNSMVQNMQTVQHNYSRDYVCSKHIDFIMSQLGNPITNYLDMKRYQGFYQKVEKSVPYKSLKFVSKLLNKK